MSPEPESENPYDVETFLTREK